jgi:hypothetical protein
MGSIVYSVMIVPLLSDTWGYEDAFGSYKGGGLGIDYRDSFTFFFTVLWQFIKIILKDSVPVSHRRENNIWEMQLREVTAANY